MATSSALEKALEEDPLDVNLFLYGIQIGEVGAMTLQAHMAQYPNIRILELKGSCIGRRGAVYLAKSLRTSQLSHLGLGRNSLDFQAATTILEALVDVPLETLDMEWNGLADCVGASIAAFLSKTRTLMSLTLERNDLRSEGIATIAKALSKNNTLQNLNLAFNRSGTIACEALGDMLEENTSLLTLNLMQCSVTVEAARHLARGLTGNHVLRCLNLQLNQAIDAFSGKTAGGTTTYPVCFNGALRELNLGGNRISSTSVELFARNLSSGTSLVALSLGKCLFGEPIVRHVIDSIALLTRLVTLDLSGCLISAASGDLLATMVTRCPSIASLYLDDNPLGRFGVESLSTGLPFCRSLTCLSLSRCDMGKEGMVSLAKSLRQRSGLPLQELRLSGNRLGYDGCLLLCDALVNMRDDASQYLEVLDISDNDIGGRSCAFLAAVLQAHRNSLLSITLRDNPISEEMKQNYLTFESALAYTGGIVSDPTLKIGAQDGGVKGTFEMDKTKRRGSSVSHGTIDSKRQSVAAGGVSPTSMLPTKSFSNFNGSTAAGFSENDDYVAGSIGRRRSSVSPQLLHREPSAVSKITLQGADTQPQPTVDSGSTAPTVHNAYAPGLTPIVPQFKQRHMLHRVEENISQLPITDTQLRIKFTQLDASCVGYLSVACCLQAFKELDPVVLDVSLKRMKERAVALCPDGRVSFQKFCVLVLQLVGQ